LGAPDYKYRRILLLGASNQNPQKELFSGAFFFLEFVTCKIFWGLEILSLTRPPPWEQ
jgi:hypothetical protein